MEQQSNRAHRVTKEKKKYDGQYTVEQAGRNGAML
jgi:hypothetical protein